MEEALDLSFDRLLMMMIAVVTQLYYNVYIIYQHQLHVSAIAVVAIFRLDTIFITLHCHRKDNTCYMPGSLPYAHTPTDFVQNEISFPLRTLILIIVVCYIISI